MGPFSLPSLPHRPVACYPILFFYVLFPPSLSTPPAASPQQRRPATSSPHLPAGSPTLSSSSSGAGAVFSPSLGHNGRAPAGGSATSAPVDWQSNADIARSLTATLTSPRPMPQAARAAAAAAAAVASVTAIINGGATASAASPAAAPATTAGVAGAADSSRNAAEPQTVAASPPAAASTAASAAMDAWMAEAMQDADETALLCHEDLRAQRKKEVPITRRWARVPFSSSSGTHASAAERARMKRSYTMFLPLCPLRLPYYWGFAAHSTRAAARAFTASWHPSAFGWPTSAANSSAPSRLSPSPTSASPAPHHTPHPQQEKRRYQPPGRQGKWSTNNTLCGVRHERAWSA